MIFYFQVISLQRLIFFLPILFDGYFIRSRVLKTLYSDQSPFKDYPLVLCGHSLGAGCASILSIMLRPAFPSLKCFGYCPPGAVCSNDMAQFCEEFITCFVRHDDLGKWFDIVCNNFQSHIPGTNASLQFPESRIKILVSSFFSLLYVH